MAEPFSLWQRGSRRAKKKDESKIKKKKSDLIWYAQYRDPITGKQITPKSTRQKSKAAALTWALKNKDRIIAKCHEDEKNPLETMLLDFYAKDSVYLERMKNRKGLISESHNTIIYAA